MTHLLGFVPRIITNLSEYEKELVIEFLQLLTSKYEIGYNHWHLGCFHIKHSKYMIAAGDDAFSDSVMVQRGPEPNGIFSAHAVPSIMYIYAVLAVVPLYICLAKGLGIGIIKLNFECVSKRLSRADTRILAVKCLILQYLKYTFCLKESILWG